MVLLYLKGEVMTCIKLSLLWLREKQHTTIYCRLVRLFCDSMARNVRKNLSGRNALFLKNLAAL